MRKISKNIAVIGSLIASTSVLTGCLDSDDEVIQSKITAANAKQVVATSFGSLDSLSALDELEIPLPLNKRSQYFAKGSYYEQALSKALIYCGDDPNTDTGQGSMDINFSGNPPTEFHFDIVFDQCSADLETTIDGGFAIDITGDGPIGPNVGDGSNTIVHTFDQLSIINTSQNFDLLVNGTIETVLAYTDPVLTFTETVNLDFAFNNSNISYNNWVRQLQLDFEQQSISVSVSGSIDASDLEGSFTFEMIEPIMFLAQNNGDDLEPTVAVSGKFKITAENGSSVTVTILDAQSALLEIDENGDGVIDITITVTLEELEMDDLGED